MKWQKMKTKREEACSKDSIILKPKPQCTFKAQCESAKSKMYATSQKDNVPVRTWNRSEFRTRISLFHCFISLKIVVLSFLSQTVYVYMCALFNWRRQVLIQYTYKHMSLISNLFTHPWQCTTRELNFFICKKKQ